MGSSNNVIKIKLEIFLASVSALLGTLVLVRTIRLTYAQNRRKAKVRADLIYLIFV